MRLSFAVGVWALALSASAQTLSFSDPAGARLPGNPRSPVRVDPFEFALLTGAKFEFKEAVQLSPAGEFTGNPLRGGVIRTVVNSPVSRIALLTAKGHTLVYVNGVPRAGDPYGYGYLTLPVELKAGANEFVFVVGRGQLTATLSEPTSPVTLHPSDMTLPDVRPGDSGEKLAGITIVNSTAEWKRGLVIEADGVRSKLPDVMPMSIRKVPYRYPAKGGALSLALVDGRGDTLSRLSFDRPIAAPGASYRETFMSRVDGSVQYYAVNPSSRASTGQALFLSLHGASVEAIGQAQAYGSKTWGHLVAATNRRPFGFDWEDIGMQDALEVLEIARDRLQTDPRKTYVLGHSMGGHGTWQMGAHFPGEFAGVGPCAAWQSFATYGGGKPASGDSDVAKMILRAWSPSDTAVLAKNFTNQNVFVLHGDADTTVPVSEARTMRGIVEPFANLKWHEEPGQGHWYDTDPEPGANCVDYAPMFDMFRSARLPELSRLSKVQFTTVNPAVSAKRDWLTIEQQERALFPSTIQAEILGSELTITVTNTRRFTLARNEMPTFSTLTINGVSVRLPNDIEPVELAKTESGWSTESRKGWRKTELSAPSAQNFKDVFRNRFCVVLPTDPTADEENLVRFLSESYAYRGNGSFDVYTDDQPLKTFVNRNIIIVGNEHRNRLYRKVATPLKVTAKDAAYLAVRPRKGDASLSVGVLAATSPSAFRLLERAPLWTAGAHIPGVFVFNATMLQRGLPGVVAAGFATPAQPNTAPTDITGKL